jgi:hypothetical protein
MKSVKPGKLRDLQPGEIETKLTDSREELMNYWNKGWACLFTALESLTEDDILKTVYIRKEAHSVLRALQRQLVHYAYHSGK